MFQPSSIELVHVVIVNDHQVTVFTVVIHMGRRTGRAVEAIRRIHTVKGFIFGLARIAQILIGARHEVRFQTGGGSGHTPCQRIRCRLLLLRHVDRLAVIRCGILLQTGFERHERISLGRLPCHFCGAFVFYCVRLLFFFVVFVFRENTK